MKSITKSILFLLVLLSVERSFSKIIRRYYYTGILYESKTTDSPKIDYADTSPDEWKDLNKLIKKYGLSAKGMFCSNGVGAWIAYPIVGFSPGGIGSQLIVGEQCIFTEDINSIQPIGYIYGGQKSGIAYFGAKYLAGKGTTIQKGSISADIKSLIYIGSQPWSLEGSGKKGSVKFCIMREQMLDKVCILRDLANEMGITESKLTLKKGCTPDMKNYYLQTCYSEGYHEIAYMYNFSPEILKGICKGGKDNSPSRLQFSSIMEIWSSRISKGAEEYGTIPMNNPEVQYKVDFLMEIIDIFAQSCPRVSRMYLSILGNVFLIHMRQVWNDKSLVGGKPNQEWIQAWDFLQHCGVAVTSGDPSVHLPVECKPTDPSTMGNEHEELAMELMYQGHTFDTVIEQVWLILNFVSPYCSHLDDYRNNLWTDFPALFKRHFLIPLQNQWLKPGDWMKVYPSMFNGFDIHDQHEGILACVQSSIHATPFLDPVGRTRIFDDFFWQNNSLISGNETSGDGEKPDKTDPEAPDESETPPSEPVEDGAEPKDASSSGRSVVFRPGNKKGRVVQKEKGMQGKRRGRRIGMKGRRKGRRMGKNGTKIGKAGRKVQTGPVKPSGRDMKVKPVVVKNSTSPKAEPQKEG